MTGLSDYKVNACPELTSSSVLLTFKILLITIMTVIIESRVFKPAR